MSSFEHAVWHTRFLKYRLAQFELVEIDSQSHSTTRVGGLCAVVGIQLLQILYEIFLVCLGFLPGVFAFLPGLPSQEVLVPQVEHDLTDAVPGD